MSRIDSLARIYDEFDGKVARFSDSACLSCPLGCGDCCDHADTEVSDTEAQLIADWILERPEIETRLERALADPDRTECVFYDRDKNFHCTIYPVRPLICRAFGYSAYSDRSGNSLFAICPSMPVAGASGGVMPVLFEPFPPVVETYRKRIDDLEIGRPRRRPLGGAVSRALEELRSGDSESRERE